MPYLDPTETAHAQAAPKFCPLCGCPAKTMWTPRTGQIVRTPEYRAIAFAVHVCTKCDVTFQIRKMPKHGLYETRKAAREAAKPIIAKKNAEYLRWRRRYGYRF